MNILAWELRGRDLGRALNLTKQARDMATGKPFMFEPYQKGLADSLSCFGRLSLRLSNYQSAMTSFSEALTIFEQIGRRDKIAVQLNLLGTTFVHAGNYPEAVRQLLTARKIFNEIRDRKNEAEILNDIGFVYILLRKTEKGIPYLEEALQIAKDNLLKKQEAIVLCSLSKAYYHLRDYEIGLEYGHDSVEICREIKDTRFEIEALINIGKIYLAEKKFGPAIDDLNSALELAKQLDLSEEEAVILKLIGYAYYSQGNADQGHDFLKRALVKAENSKAWGLVYKCHRALSREFSKTGDYRQAFTHLEQFHLIKEKVMKRETDLKLQNLRLAHDLYKEKIETDILDLRKELFGEDDDEPVKPETEKKKMIEEIKQVVCNARTMQGFLPICSSCKQIRDDKGQWHQVDVFIQKNTGINFSHGICPDCKLELYSKFK